MRHGFVSTLCALLDQEMQLNSLLWYRSRHGQMKCYTAPEDELSEYFVPRTLSKTRLAFLATHAVRGAMLSTPTKCLGEERWLSSEPLIQHEAFTALT